MRALRFHKGEYNFSTYFGLALAWLRWGWLGAGGWGGGVSGLTVHL